MHADAAHVAVAQLDLAGVQPGPELKPDAAQLVAEGGRATDPPAGTVEGGQHPIAGRLDQLAAELLDHPPGHLVVHVEQLAPAPVAEPSGPLGGADDVGEQHGGQHPAGFGSPADASEELLDLVKRELRRLPDQRRVGPRELDQPCPGMCSAR